MLLLLLLLPLWVCGAWAWCAILWLCDQHEFALCWYSNCNETLLAELDALMRTLAGGPDRWPPTGQGVHCQHSCDIDVWDRHAIGLAGVVRDPLIRTCAVRCGRRPSVETMKYAAAAEP